MEKEDEDDDGLLLHIAAAPLESVLRLFPVPFFFIDIIEYDIQFTSLSPTTTTVTLNAQGIWSVCPPTATNAHGQVREHLEADISDKLQQLRARGAALANPQTDDGSNTGA